MSIKSLIRLKKLWVAAAVLMILVAFLAYNQRPSTQSISLDERSDEWVVTGFSYASDSEPLLRVLNVDILWGKENASNETQTTSAPWSLKGTIEEGNTRIAIVDVDKESREVKRERYVRFNVGDTLPNGAKVTKIGKNQIEFEMNGETYVKKLYE